AGHDRRRASLPTARRREVEPDRARPEPRHQVRISAPQIEHAGARRHRRDQPIVARGAPGPGEHRRRDPGPRGMEPAQERLAIAHPTTLPCHALSLHPPGVPTRVAPPAGLAGFAMVAIAAAAWGTWSLILRPTHLPATVSCPIIFLVMGLVALPGALRGPRTAWDRRTLGLVALNAGFDALNAVAFFAAIDHTTVAIAVLSHYLAPILIALAA